MNTIQDTLEYILKAITPEDTPIDIDAIPSEGYITLTVKLPQEIIGQVIGRQGHTIKAIRTLLNLSHPQEKYVLDITE